MAREPGRLLRRVDEIAVCQRRILARRRRHVVHHPVPEVHAQGVHVSVCGTGLAANEPRPKFGPGHAGAIARIHIETAHAAAMLRARDVIAADVGRHRDVFVGRRSEKRRTQRQCPHLRCAEVFDDLRTRVVRGAAIENAGRRNPRTVSGQRVHHCGPSLPASYSFSAPSGIANRAFSDTRRPAMIGQAPS